jgi:hypothetical protein
MRRTTLTTFLAAAAMVAAGCADAPQAPSAPPDPVMPNLTVVSAASLRTQIDALLTGTARLAAHLQLRRVEQDIQYKRPMLYVDALVLAGIALREREAHHIPPDKIATLFEFLCRISQFIKPHLPPWLAAIDFCTINPVQVGNDSKIQVVTNAMGGTVTTPRQTFSLDIEGSSMFDAAGNPVPFVLVVVLPQFRQQPTEGEQHPCPLPWDSEGFPQSQVDCYEEFYELSVTPRVRFEPVADLEVCQLDPHSDDENAPTGEGVFDRLELFIKDVNGSVQILPNPDAVSDADAECRPDNIEHPEGGDGVGGVATGPMGWSRNALARVARLGSQAVSMFRPRLLYADNVPTHGDLGDQLLAFGNVVGAIDRRGRGGASVASVTVSPATEPTCGEGTHYCHSQPLTLVATPYNEAGNQITSGVTCTWTADNGTFTPATTTAYPHTSVLSGVENPGEQFFTVAVEAVCNGVGVSETLPYQVDNW